MQSPVPKDTSTKQLLHSRLKKHLAVRSTYCPCRGPEFGSQSQCLLGSSQLPKAPDEVAPKPLASSGRPVRMHTHTQIYILGIGSG